MVSSAHTIFLKEFIYLLSESLLEANPIFAKNIRLVFVVRMIIL